MKLEAKARIIRKAADGKGFETILPGAQFSSEIESEYLPLIKSGSAIYAAQPEEAKEPAAPKRATKKKAPAAPEAKETSPADEPEKVEAEKAEDV